MNEASSSGTRPIAEASPERDPRDERLVAPVFPLLLLETLRDLDLPPEVLEDEDVSISMPRRLGLSDVVLVQIQRFREALKQKQPQSPAVVQDLIRLVVRRPDADEIFDQAGRRVAQWYWDQRMGVMRGVIRFMPRPISLFAASRAGRRMFSRLSGSRHQSIQRWPVKLVIRNPLTVGGDPGGAACMFYTGALSEMLKLYTGRPYRVRHVKCETRGAGQCEWSVELAG